MSMSVCSTGLVYFYERIDVDFVVRIFIELGDLLIFGRGPL